MFDIFECNTIKIVSPHLLACFLLQRKTIQVNLQKDVISTQKQPSCKKGAALCKMASMKKVVKYRWQPRNGCDSRLVIKILITTIQVNLCCPAKKNLLELILLKFLSLTLPSQPFLGPHLYFTTFFILAILHTAAPFFTAWLFLSK